MIKKSSPSKIKRFVAKLRVLEVNEIDKYRIVHMIVIDCSLRGICVPVTLLFDYSFCCCFLFSFQLIKNSRFRFNFPLNAASRKGVGKGAGCRVPLERGSLAQLRYINCFICVESAFLFNKLLIVSQTQSATRGRERGRYAKWLATLCLPHCACHLQPFEFISLCNAIRLRQVMKIYCFH